MKDDKQAQDFKKGGSYETRVKEPTFRKGAPVRPDVLRIANEVFDQRENLMKRLEDL